MSLSEGCASVMSHAGQKPLLNILKLGPVEPEVWPVSACKLQLHDRVPRQVLGHAAVHDLPPARKLAPGGVGGVLANDIH
eukprot:9480716-Pyramimonas_sp.AAC.1